MSMCPVYESLAAASALPKKAAMCSGVRLCLASELMACLGSIPLADTAITKDYCRLDRALLFPGTVAVRRIALSHTGCPTRRSWNSRNPSYGTPERVYGLSLRVAEVLEPLRDPWVPWCCLLDFRPGVYGPSGLHGLLDRSSRDRIQIASKCSAGVRGGSQNSELGALCVYSFRFSVQSLGYRVLQRYDLNASGSHKGSLNLKHSLSAGI